MKPTEYIRSDRRGREAHDLEMEAQRDPFLAEALEGLESAEGDHTAAAEALKHRIAARAVREARRRRIVIIRRIAAAAAAVLVLATAGVVTWRKAPDPSAGSGTYADHTPALSAADTPADSLADSPAGRARTGSGDAARDRDRDRLAAKSPTDRPADPAVSSAARPATGTAPSEPASPKTPAGGGSPAQPAQTPSGPKAPAAAPASARSAGGTPSVAHPDREEHDPAGSVPDRSQPDDTGVSAEEVKVIGFGTARKSDFTGSVGALTGDESGSPLPADDKPAHSRSTGKDAEARPAAGTDRTGSAFPTAGADAETPPHESGRAAGSDPAHPLSADRSESGPERIIAQAEPPGAAAEDRPFLTAETMPRFQGGDLTDFRRWVQARVRKPEIALANGIQGRIVVSFVIDTLGRLTDIRVLQSPDRTLSDEAVRVLDTSPRWEPGRQGEKKTKVKYTMSVDFGRQH